MLELTSMIKLVGFNCASLGAIRKIRSSELFHYYLVRLEQPGCEPLLACCWSGGALARAGPKPLQKAQEKAYPLAYPWAYQARLIMRMRASGRN